MKRVILVFSILACVMATAYAHNPFTTKPENQHRAAKPVLNSDFFLRIIGWQHDLRERISGLLRDTKSGGDITPLLLLCFFTYAYGVVHSAGPGHGKAVALSYIMSCRPSISTGLVFGNIVAITHGVSGIALVLIVKFLLEASISSSLETMTYVTQVLSFSMICLMGLGIVIKGLTRWARQSAAPIHSPGRSARRHYAAAVAVGLVPCPGVVMVMLFAMSLNLTGLGVFLGFCIAAGMASTITVIVMTAMSGKATALKLTAENTRRYRIIENSVEILAGLFVLVLGATFLLANL